LSAGRALAAAVSAALAFAACAPSAYDAYRAAHPEWDGAFPTADADLTRTLAALRGTPGRGYTTTVQALQVYELRGGDWIAIEPPAAPSATASYGVFAALQCVADDGETHFVSSQHNWYLLRDDRLVAWDHHRYASGCNASDDFAAARPDLASEEQKLLERVGLCRPACGMDAAEVYAKGQSFARVGRFAEAREMLALGDRTGSSGFDVRQRFSDSRGSQHASEAALAAARDALVRDLAASGK
jgi:hypothetical protein